MKRISVIILSAILLLAAGVNLAALDYGGSLTSATGYSSAPAGGLTNEEAVGIWFETGKGEHYSFEMKTDHIASITDEGFQFYINPDYVKLDGLWDNLDYGPSILATSIGRFATADFSTKVFSQSLDGMIWNFNYPAFELTIAAGSTALFFSETGNMLTTSKPVVMSRTDASELENSAGLFEYLSDKAAADAAGKSVLGSPRAVEIVTLTVPQIIAKQSITLSLVAQEDLRPMLDVLQSYSNPDYVSSLIQEGETDQDLTRGGAVDTQYIGAGVSGPSIPGLYHNVYYYFGTGRALTYAENIYSETGFAYQYDMIISHMAGLSVDYYMPWLFNSKAGIGATFGTGDADADSIYEGNKAENYTQFTPITGGGGGMIFSPGLSNIFTANANYSIKPLEWMDLPFISSMQVTAAAMPFFRIVDGPIAISGLSDDFDGNYLGSEIDLSVNMRPFSDLGVAVMGGYFLPNAVAFAGSDMENPSFMVKLNVSMSF